ncbi:Transcriptional regulatory protein DegU [Rubripirellula tenax]|uniref:Transcriptional regulatory protein DegU n=1 Tax=Rubripirellula tenax TaxID=2528015 RepID=A0A5C6EIB7_9BACT|nr:response regulator transcription factor [Rubripirellula tenax]TWU47396.1 Transcriptional regulatory protein DegU [Rubripirellula tenax]
MISRVLIVDDHDVARMGLACMLETEGFSIAGSVATGGEAVTFLAGTDSVELVILDIQMPASDGLATLQKIRESHPDMKVVVLSSYDNPTYIARATALGAQDYILKGVSFGSVLNSLKRAIEGQPPPEDSRLSRISKIMQRVINPEELPAEMPLTGREAQVLRHVALGLSNKEVARSLSISVETVKEHVQNILRKTNANDRTDAAVRAVKLGLAD